VAGAGLSEPLKEVAGTEELLSKKNRGLRRYRNRSRLLACPMLFDPDSDIDADPDVYLLRFGLNLCYAPTLKIELTAAPITISKIYAPASHKAAVDVFSLRETME
jgi:hypothetical protein